MGGVAPRWRQEGIREAPERQQGGAWEAAWGHQGGTVEATGRRQGGHKEATGRPQGGQPLGSVGGSRELLGSLRVSVPWGLLGDLRKAHGALLGDKARRCTAPRKTMFLLHVARFRGLRAASGSSPFFFLLTATKGLIDLF